MAQMNVASEVSWSYNGTGNLVTIGTFRNPSKSQRAEISSVTLKLGTVNGLCTDGDRVRGYGKPISTYLQINGTNSGSVTVRKVVGVTGSGKTYPIRSQMTNYTFTFSSAVSVPAGSSASIKIKTPSSSNGLVLGFDGNSGLTVTYQNIPNIQPAPQNVRISCTDFTSTTISWKVTTSSSATSCRVYLDGGLKTTVGMSGNQATGTLTGVSSTTHSIKAEAMNVNSSWVGSNTVNVDCTIPPINNLRVVPTSSNKGVLHFTSTYNVDYTLTGSDGVQYASGNVGKNQDPSVTISLKNNSNISYTLKIARTDNTKITNSKSTGNVDTRVAKITLSGTAEGILFNFTATADYSCKNWYYVLQDTVTGNQNIASYNTGVTTTTKYTLDELVPQRNYRLYVYATTNSSGLIATSNVINFKVNGCGRVYDGGKEKVVTVYIYDSTAQQWKQYVPYVWNGNEWVICG